MKNNSSFKKSNDKKTSGKTKLKSSSKKRNYSKENNQSRKARKMPLAVKPSNDFPIRLNRYIANAGICSRRKADELIDEGKVEINHKIVWELGTKVNRGDKVFVEGKLIRREKLVYVLLNKPKNYITTTNDPEERKTVMDLVERATDERILPVGRLDRNTTGLLLFTNDGDLTQRLTHPKHQIKKVYQVNLNTPLTKLDAQKIANGLQLEDGLAEVDAIGFPNPQDKREIGVEIHSGRNRIVRRIFESLDYEVEKLDRVLYAGLTKKDLPRGKWRFLTQREIGQLKKSKKIEIIKNQK